MKDEELLRQLQSLVSPPEKPTARERARIRALAALREDARSPEPASPWRPWAAVAVAVLLAAALILKPSAPSRSPSTNDAALLTQMESVFPGSLDAVIERDGKVQLAIADRPSQASDQRVLVEFQRGKSIVRVMSYSGRHVCLDLEGRQACFDVLLDQQGDVIVAGEDFVVSPVQSMSARGWKVSAVALAHSI